MEVQHLRHLLAAATSQNYVQAATVCFTSRQNIAHSIKLIEKELNVTLFVRQGNTMVLTPEGKMVANEASFIIDRLDSIKKAFDESAALERPLDVAVSTNLFAGVPSSVTTLVEEYTNNVRGVSAKNRGMLLEVGCGECYRLVSEEDLDCAIAMCMKRSFPKCEAIELANSISYVLVDSDSALAHQSHFSWEMLRDHRMLLMDAPDAQYLPLFDYLESAGFNPRKINIIPSTSSMIHLVKHSGAVGIVSEKFALNPPDGTHAIPILDMKLRWHFYLLYRTGRENDRIVAKLAENIQRLFYDDGMCGNAS